MWIKKHKIALLLWIALLTLGGSLMIKEEASLLFLIAFLASFAAGLFYSIDFRTREYRP